MSGLILNGVLRDESPDPRNYNVSRFVPGQDIIKDEEFMLKFPETQIIIDQGSIGACVGHSFIMAKQLLEYMHTNKWIDFDPFMLYGTRFLGDYIGVGMIPFQGAKVLYKEGAYLRRDFNIRQEMPQLKDIVEDWKQKNNDKVEEASMYKITGYSYVYNEQDIKKALKNKMPISVAYPIYPSFYNTGMDGKVPVANPKTEKDTGYHQMLIVGWTKDNYWVVLNSWGVNFGFKGVYFIPFENKFDTAIAVSDTITPSKYKAKEIKFSIGDANYMVDDVVQTFDVIPYLANERTYVPIRFISEALGCSVEWEEETEKVTIRSEEAIITLNIGSNIVKINNDIRHIDVAPELHTDRTMLPIRVIAESLNCRVDWIDESHTVVIKAL